MGLSTGASGSGPLEFWAEYEGPTFCEYLAGGDQTPRAVQSIDAKSGRPTMNTDPWVFTPGFVWSLCRHGAITRDIRRGDLVLFGSTLAGNLVLDTVMVIDMRISGRPGAVGGVYDHLVLPTIEGAFWPYVGRPRASGGPFSFVPARRANESHQPFRRPAVNQLFSSLRTIKGGHRPSPRNAQALVFCETDGDLSSFWQLVVDEVERAGLVLGTAFSHPSSPADLQGVETVDCRAVTDCRPTRRWSRRGLN
jgi:hypothetical protein